VAKPLLPEELWRAIEPLLPRRAPSAAGGRPRLPDKQALLGVLFVLKTGLPWEDLPAELGCGSGMSCWRRLRDWQADGTWQRIREALLQRLDGAGRLDWSKAAVDGAGVRAVSGGRDRPPPDRPRQARVEAPREGGRRRPPPLRRIGRPPAGVRRGVGRPPPAPTGWV
jgi:transposase